MAQKLLLFWRKPARRCWWEGVELDDVEGVEGKVKVWIRRVWTLEMVSPLDSSIWKVMVWVRSEDIYLRSLNRVLLDYVDRLSNWILNLWLAVGSLFGAKRPWCCTASIFKMGNCVELYCIAGDGG